MTGTEASPDTGTSPGCPLWCVAEHGAFAGEESGIHEGEPLWIAEGVPARLRMSVDPHSGVPDGPYLFVGTCEYTIEAACALATSLAALAASASSAEAVRVIPPEAS